MPPEEVRSLSHYPAAEKRLKSEEEELAGVEGFEPPNGGIKTPHFIITYQQVTEFYTLAIPTHPLNSPPLPLGLPLAPVRRPWPGTWHKECLPLSASPVSLCKRATLYQFGRKLGYH